MKYTLTLLALTLATFTSALPQPAGPGGAMEKRGGVNGAAYAHSPGGSSGPSWGGEDHEGPNGWGPPQKKRSSPAPGDSWGQGSGGESNGQGLDNRAAVDERRGINAAAYAHPQGQSDSPTWGPPEQGEKRDVKERSSPAPGDSWGQGSGGKSNGQGLDFTPKER